MLTVLSKVLGAVMCVYHDSTNTIVKLKCKDILFSLFDFMLNCMHGCEHVFNVKKCEQCLLNLVTDDKETFAVDTITEI